VPADRDKGHVFPWGFCKLVFSWPRKSTRCYVRISSECNSPGASIGKGTHGSPFPCLLLYYDDDYDEIPLPVCKILYFVRGMELLAE